jgi:hypothetical protein
MTGGLMRRHRRLAIGLVFGLLAVVSLSGAALATGVRGSGLAVEVYTLETPLYGAEEFPVTGDPDGSGWAAVSFQPRWGRVCYTLVVHDIAPTFAAHIHDGEAGTAGPVVVNFMPPTSGLSRGCTSGVDRDLILDILSNPDDYYVNVHNAPYPGGAVRGQLGD